MATRNAKIVAEDIVKDIRKGHGYGELMEKHRVTEKQLERILRRLVNVGMIEEQETSAIGKPKRKINASKIVNDLRSGMTDQDLMAKYGISELQLEKILGKIVDAGMMSDMELFERSTLSESTVTKCFVETQQSIRELDPTSPDHAVRDVVSSESVEVTEVLPLPGSFLDDMLSRLKG